jgi:NTP pyrophosphatase (non-canonical NTP hydrolase)
MTTAEREAPAGLTRDAQAVWRQGYAAGRTAGGLGDFHRTSIERSRTGFGSHGDWSLADWMTAVVGELGELANLLKKRRRGESILLTDIHDEWADTFTYLMLLADALDITDPMDLVWRKFNKVSERIGWSPDA